MAIEGRACENSLVPENLTNYVNMAAAAGTRSYLGLDSR
jgi:hypothetical protein